MLSLRDADHELWVYTSSYRHPWRVRALFAAHGVGLDGVINQARHDRRGRSAPLKAPATFGIGALVDDSQAVAEQCAGSSCVVINVRPDDEGWAEYVCARLTNRGRSFTEASYERRGAGVFALRQLSGRNHHLTEG
jgi:hypothetical protein